MISPKISWYGFPNKSMCLCQMSRKFNQIHQHWDLKTWLFAYWPLKLSIIEISIIFIPPTPPAACITAFFITEARWYLNVPHAFCFTTLRRLWRRHLATQKNTWSILMRASDRYFFRYFLFDIVPLLVDWQNELVGLIVELQQVYLPPIVFQTVSGTRMPFMLVRMGA